MKDGDFEMKVDVKRIKWKTINPAIAVLSHFAGIIPAPECTASLAALMRVRVPHFWNQLTSLIMKECKLWSSKVSEVVSQNTYIGHSIFSRNCIFLF